MTDQTHSVLTLFQDPAFRLWYMLGGAVLLALPMFLLARWYHREILKSPGGRELMKRQNRNPVRRGNVVAASSQLNTGIGLMKSISRGRFGDHARATQSKAYWVVGLWVAANVVYFGLLIWADEVARSSMAP